jgi:hypothetical protein
LEVIRVFLPVIFLMKGSLSITVLILHLIAQDSQAGLEYLCPFTV